MATARSLTITSATKVAIKTETVTCGLWIGMVRSCGRETFGKFFSGRRSMRLLNFEVLADGVVPGFVMLVGVLGVEKACCGEGLVENGCKLGGGRVSTF